MKHILFVCTGNTFRSASAEYLLRKYLNDEGDDSFIVSSAGTKGNPYGMYDSMVKAVKKHGVDPSKHKYRVVNASIVNDADIIVCFSQKHVDFIRNNFDRTGHLFNYLAMGEETDLKDDDEAAGSYDDLDQFVKRTVDEIASKIPDVYASIERMS